MQAAAARTASALRSIAGARRGGLSAPWAGIRFDRTIAASAHSAAPAVKLLIDGKFIDSKAKEFVDVHDPATQEVVCRVPLVRHWRSVAPAMTGAAFVHGSTFYAS